MKTTILHFFCGSGTVTQSICRSDKIIMTNILQQCVVNLYHTYLLYTVMECTEATISQHYYCPNLRKACVTKLRVAKLAGTRRNKTSNMDNSLQNKRNPYHGTDPWWILQYNIQVIQLVVIGKYLMLIVPRVSAIVYSGEQYSRQKIF